MVKKKNYFNGFHKISLFIIYIKFEFKKNTKDNISIEYSTCTLYHSLNLLNLISE